MPASAIFIVTHNIEEAVMLAGSRDGVLGLESGASSFRFQYSAEASGGTASPARFVELVDYIYKVSDRARNSSTTCRMPSNDRRNHLADRRVNQGVG